jgi:intracellular multiplication protein IcmV
MGLLNKTKKTVISTFPVDKWLDLDNLKNNAKFTTDAAKSLFTPKQATMPETFDSAVDRLDLSEKDIKQRQTEFLRLYWFFTGFCVLMFVYGLYLVSKSSVNGFCVTFALAIYLLTQAFKYHFWYFQIKNRKLGCTLKDWFQMK